MYLLLMPYIVISCAYCIDAWRASRLSRILKPLLMPSLLMGYCFAARPVQPLIAIGIALGFVGDVALMLHGDWAFIAGLAGFLLGHVMYSIWFIIQTGGAFSPWTLFYIPLAIAAGVMLFRHLRPGLKQMKLPALCYDIVIFFMSTCAFTLLLARPCVGSALIWIGSLSFIVSDSILAEGIFLSERAHHHFKVMTTYTFAQFAIALGATLM